MRNVLIGLICVVGLLVLLEALIDVRPLEPSEQIGTFQSVSQEQAEETRRQDTDD